jgi:AraC family transcriptional regulator, regulatory protein of adaptative response / methylated-DNA-[protein]-cysteine methyltransferase
MANRNHTELIQHACRKLESPDKAPDLATLAAAAGLSAWHFQRLFTLHVGVSPKRYAMAHRQRRLDAAIRTAPSVTDAIYAAGYSASSAAYRDSQHWGMAPTRIQQGGADEIISYSPAITSLGRILVAATQRGVCMVEFGTQKVLLPELQKRFPRAIITRADQSLATWVIQVVSLIDDPRAGTQLPLDIRGTAFQIRVWHALGKIKPGVTLSYSQLAKRIRSPLSTRAVARACATNHLAVVIPCHRVISGTGELNGYKWGIARKRRLLAQESIDVPRVQAPLPDIR